ncbi:MAG: oligopeptide transporter, OPT family [Ignavibacteriota bacterium]|jgi:putative OPT family oligopeptide transporter|nr:MAG: oligopeptide transporter, OPT family [Chlorobiota bacterium]MBE7477351.1 oligopeptide transporter, OPT family [Ignavibacteriales bacterium]MBL1122752.1 oligopeptide transporter, OPT family [Ignavibacteriota bacterium]MCC7094481.1 oligopeptide transporter, OPT family [Ignavibacteriaceae bacterium]MCE7856764.1 oligopeptide transporter, OPT family [Ignavibacteria bacterium CHB3]MEB2295571.1 oligopeptide transporter, OPT family [Ignavibacteria bacterium]
MAETKRFVPFVSPETSMAEFTIRALIIGLILAVVLGAANAYLGLKAGMTIAATYPAAVIGMALIKIMKGSILEENFTRTVGSIGESIAAGAIFTLPAFFIGGIWVPFFTTENFLISVAIMIAGGILGIMFVALLRRVMVEDVELPFPESVAAAEIHKAGRHGTGGSKFLFSAMGIGALIQALGQFKLFATSWTSMINVGKGHIFFRSPDVSPAYIGVGYIIGPRLASLNFSGGVLAWGLLAPTIAFFKYFSTETPADFDWATTMVQVWKDYVRPIAIGGMLVGAGFTLWRMRKSLMTGIARSISDVKKAATGEFVEIRTEKDISFKWVMIGILGTAVATFFIYNYFSQDIFAALVATIVMIVAGFFFAAVSGYLVGIIGSSNNPISGLTLSTLVVAAILMVALGMKGEAGVAAVLGVAAVVCVAAAVAGEMLQDLKAGHILGGTPWKMQVGDVIGVVVSAAVMFIPLLILHEGDIKSGGTGFGGDALPAPQASLMAILSKGIVAGQMDWILIFVGMLMGVGFILMNVKSPMLVSVGMYLPLGTTFAIFVGGLIKGIVEKYNDKKQFNDAQKSRVENTGILIAAGLIAGEALIGLLFAAFAFWEVSLFAFFAEPSFIISLIVFSFIGWLLVNIPLKNAGKPDDPPPPHVSM